MRYIVHRRFKGICINGNTNLPYGTEIDEVNGLFYHNGEAVCVATSENAHQFFARNDDGNGLERGKLTQNIQKTLSKLDEDHQVRWDKVWEDFLCQKYKRKEYSDYWLWNHAFYNAPIEDLRHIAKLVGAV